MIPYRTQTHCPRYAHTTCMLPNKCPGLPHVLIVSMSQLPQLSISPREYFTVCSESHRVSTTNASGNSPHHIGTQLSEELGAGLVAVLTSPQPTTRPFTTRIHLWRREGACQRVFSNNGKALVDSH